MLSTTVASDIGTYDIVLLADDHISNLIRNSGRPYESALVAIVRELTEPGATILDVGANLGNHTIYWAKAGRRVIGFEPNPATANALRESVRINRLERWVTLHQVALGSVAAQGDLRLLLPANQGAIAVEPAATGAISIVRLDDMDVPNFSIMKIDVEGAEEAVLAGALDTITRVRPIVIAEDREGNALVRSVLRSMGYRRVPVSLAYTPTYLYVPSMRSFGGLLRSRTLVRRMLGEMARRIGLRHRAR